MIRCLIFATILLFSLAAQDAPLTPKSLQAALAGKPQGAEAEKLADKVRSLFGKDDLLKAPAPKVDDLTVAWAIETPGAKTPPRVVSDDAKYILPQKPGAPEGKLIEIPKWSSKIFV